MDCYISEKNENKIHSNSENPIGKENSNQTLFGFDFLYKIIQTL